MRTGRLRSAKKSHACWAIAAAPARARAAAGGPACRRPSRRRGKRPATGCGLRKDRPRPRGPPGDFRPRGHPQPAPRTTRTQGRREEVDDGDAVAGVMQNVVGGDLDRLQVRREQLEILGAEPSQQIVPGPAGHSSCLWALRWPGIGVSRKTLRFRAGTDSSKVNTSVCGKPKSSQQRGVAPSGVARRTRCELCSHPENYGISK